MYSIPKWSGHGYRNKNSLVPFHLPNFKLGNFSFVEGAIGVVIVVFLIGALLGPIANFTTGLTIAHTGFTPNPNITASPGAAPLLQIYPLFFAIFGLVVVAKYASKE